MTASSAIISPCVPRTAVTEICNLTNAPLLCSAVVLAISGNLLTPVFTNRWKPLVMPAAQMFSDDH
jgi:hypothetical protein